MICVRMLNIKLNDEYVILGNTVWFNFLHYLQR